MCCVGKVFIYYLWNYYNYNIGELFTFGLIHSYFKRKPFMTWSLQTKFWLMNFSVETVADKKKQEVLFRWIVCSTIILIEPGLLLKT